MKRGMEENEGGDVERESSSLAGKLFLWEPAEATGSCHGRHIESIGPREGS